MTQYNCKTIPKYRKGVAGTLIEAWCPVQGKPDKREEKRDGDILHQRQRKD